MQLVRYPNKSLISQCQQAPKYSEKEYASLAAAMWKIMDDHRGVGLAAPQVGLNIRMFVWRRYSFNDAIWNPVICAVSGINSGVEGCLSLPGVKVTKERSNQSRLIGIGIDGEQISLWGDSIHTRIWQHEIDHLDGRLIIDNMSVKNATANKSALEALQKNIET